MRWGAIAVFAVLARDAHAAPREHAALAAVDLGPKVPDHLRAKATTQIEEGLAAAGYEVVPSMQVGPRLAGALAICREGACVHSVAGALHVDAVVFASINRKDESSLITMRLYADTGERIAEIHEVCELCGDSELAEKLGIAASALRAQATEAREKKARLAEPKVLPPPPPPPPPPEQSSIIPGLVIGTIGAAAIGAGIYLVAINGHGTCSAGDTPVYPAPGAVIRVDPNDPSSFVCRDLYKTNVLGFATMAVGAAALAVGVTLIVHSTRRDRTLEVRPMPGGATATVSLTW